ncbi:MAG: LysR family transcriptional regulator [Stappiaceae bacterium]
MADMDVLALRSFIAVVETGGFTQAAPRIYRSQSAVSMQIKKLEQQLETVLLERGPAGIRLTSAGETLLGYARQIVASNDHAVSDIRKNAIAGKVRLGVMDDYATAVLPEILTRYQMQFPDVVLEVTTGTTAAFIPRLGPDFDIVIATQALNAGAGIVLRQEEVCWAYAQEKPLNFDGVVPVALMAEGNLFREWAIAALNSAGIGYRLAFVGSSIPANEAAAVAGMAVTVVKRSTVRSGLKLLSEKDGFPPLPRAEIALHIAESAQGEAAVRTLVGHLKAMI